MEEHFKVATMHVGIVVANVDPEGLGRIRVEVPGLLEPQSAWAFPIGGSGGGGPTSGWFDVPALNAFVGVLFHAGEIDHPYYLGGWHGKGEVPAYLTGVSIGDRVKVKVFETALFHMVFDDRDSAKVLLLKNKSTGDYISIADGETKIKAATKVTIETPHLDVIGDTHLGSHVANQAMLLGTAYRAAEDAMLDAMQVAAVTASNPATCISALQGISAAIIAFQTARGIASGFLSSKHKLDS